MKGPSRFSSVSGLKTAVILGMALGLHWSALAQEEGGEWPREIDHPEGVVLIYQPQLESFDQIHMKARAAVSVKPHDEDEPLFGVVWIEARVSTDRQTRIVSLVDVDVTGVRFADVAGERTQKLESLLEEEIPKWDLSVSLDRILAMMKVVEEEKKAAAELNNQPPKIIFVEHPAVLVVLDGPPRTSKIEDSSYERVVNTPFLLVHAPKTAIYYLRGDEVWYSTKDLQGEWAEVVKPPADLEALLEDESEGKVAGSEVADASTPEIIVSEEPAELISCEGAANYTLITGTDLLYIANTDRDVFMDVGSQTYYVLLSGRWYSASSMEGEWTYVPAEELPEDFARIPPTSEKKNVRASVPGTDEAEEAVLDAQIPQTAAVKRSDEPDLEIEYDGEPNYVQVEDTGVSYVENTPYTVFKVGERYYCCHEAVWYESESPYGPWFICTEVPSVIYDIPPSCPHYNATCVYVYDYTPDVVYVGYTPGYYGYYPYYGTVVYGTGYYYRGWYGRYYYPRATTYGFAVRYNPYTGSWGVRVGYRGRYGGWVRAGYRYGGGYPGGYYRRPVGWWGPSYGHAEIDRTVYTPRGTWESSAEVTRRPGEVEYERDVEGPRGRGFESEGEIERTGRGEVEGEREITTDRGKTVKSEGELERTGWGEVEGEREIITEGGKTAKTEGELERTGWGEFEGEKTTETDRGTITREVEAEYDRGEGWDVDRNTSFEPNENVYTGKSNVTMESIQQQLSAWEKTARTGQQASTYDRTTTGVSRPSTYGGAAQNNIYADHSGNVYQRTNNGWQQRSGNQWTPATNQPGFSQTSAGQLNSHYQARERGTTRTSDYRQSSHSHSSQSSHSRTRSTSPSTGHRSSPSRGGGGGGGGRR